ncbi:MAG: GIY-YIG nuclease family protein, partial [Flavobacteriales bacterium]|nr:GIY-YIG nuclease family protein [Flavobacteriales bacterium]
TEKIIEDIAPETVIVNENYEKILHMEFKDKRLRGEWFNLDETDLDFLHNKMKKFACI